MAILQSVNFHLLDENTSNLFSLQWVFTNQLHSPM